MSLLTHSCFEQRCKVTYSTYTYTYKILPLQVVGYIFRCQLKFFSAVYFYSLLYILAETDKQIAVRFAPTFLKYAHYMCLYVFEVNHINGVPFSTLRPTVFMDKLEQ